jgi:hypothetical protein
MYSGLLSQTSGTSSTCTAKTAARASKVGTRSLSFGRRGVHLCGGAVGSNSSPGCQAPRSAIHRAGLCPIQACSRRRSAWQALLLIGASRRLLGN